MTSKIIFRLLRTLRFSTIPMLLLLGCHASDPTSPKFDLGGKDVLPSAPDWPPNCSTATPLAAPVLDGQYTTTSYSLQAFRGRAPGADLMTARANGGTSKPQQVGSDGKFCIEVQLVPDIVNTVVFQAVDANGCPGKEKVIQITHRSSGTRDSGSNLPTNVAKGQPIGADSAPGVGQLSSMNDGDYGSYAELAHGRNLSACSGYNWIRVDLGKTYTVSELKVYWKSDVSSTNNFAYCYALLLSTVESPDDPSTTSSNWKVVKQDANNSDSKTLDISISPESASWAALLLYDSNASLKVHETFDVAEFEVWGQDPNATPLPPADRCE